MKKKEKYEELAQNVVGLIGEKENISYFTHCITRLRFTVKDKSRVKEKEIEKLSGVVSVNWSGDQLQVIVGPAVNDVYKLISERHGFETAEDSNGGSNVSTKRKKFTFNTLLETISGIVAPIIPVLIAAGLLKMLIMLGGMSGLLLEDSSTMLVLNFVADSGFYFLPVMAGAFAANKFGATTSLGMMLGAMLIHPNFVTALTEGKSLDLFGLPILNTSYATSIIPAILIVAVMAPVERFFKKYSPEVLRALLAPLLTLIVMIPLALCVLAPIGSYIGLYMASFFVWMYNTLGFFGVAMIAALWPILIMTGMHQALTPYVISNFATLGYDPMIIASSIIHNFSQGGACAAIALKSKVANIKAVAISCGTSAVVGGISEPAVYGVTLKYKTPFYCAMFANFIAGAIIGLNHVYVMVFNGGGIFALPVFVASDPRNLIWAVVACVIATVVSFATTLVFYKDPVDELQEELEEETTLSDEGLSVN